VDKHHKKLVRKQLVSGTLYPDNSYNYDGFYLLKHSEISVNACKTPSQASKEDVEVEVMLFKGKENWNKWKQNQESRTCAIMILPVSRYDLGEGCSSVCRASA